MLKDKNEVIEWLALNNTPYWELSRSQKGDKITIKDEPENFAIEESQECLNRFLDMFEKGTYHIAAWKKVNSSHNQRFKSSFRLGGSSGSPENANIGNLGDIENRVTERLRKEMEFDRMKAEYEEMKREINSVNHQVSKRLVPYMPYIIEGIFGINGVFGTKIKGVPVANISEIPEEDLEDYQNRLEEAFKKWFEVEKELSPVIIVEKIVELAETDPSMYAQAKKLLFSQDPLPHIQK
ncbi:hypothetical protein ES705_27673 [subsurface metagenome]